MKILHLIQKKQLRGAEVFASHLANHQLEQGHEVKLVGIFVGKETLPFRGDIIELQSSSRNRFTDYKRWKELGRIIREFQPDIVQANAGDTLKYAVFSKMLFGWSSKLVFRNASTVSKYIKHPIIRLLNAFLYGQVDTIISVSAASRKDLNTLFPGTRSKTTVIPVGIEPVKNSTVASFDTSVTHILHVGGFTFEKNHQGLLRIFEQTIQQHRNLHLHLVGNGPLLPEIKNKVVGLGLEKVVTFHGFQNDVLQYMRAADLLILPSILEGLPGVILEAQFCRLPVIAYDVGGISEIVKHRYTGWLIDQGNESAFVEAIVEVLKSTNDRAQQIQVQKIVEAAYCQVIEQYDNRSIAMKFLQTYKCPKGI